MKIYVNTYNSFQLVLVSVEFPCIFRNNLNKLVIFRVVKILFHGKIICQRLWLFWIICSGNNLVIDVSLFLKLHNTCAIAVSNWKCTTGIFVLYA